jgi:hypothetical protein
MAGRFDAVMPDPSPRQLLHEWQQRMESVVASAASVADRSELSHQLLEAMRREVELLQEVVERERRLRQEVTDHVVAPIEAVFELLEQSSAAFRQQADALEAAGRALELTAQQVKMQAQLFERTVDALRQPAKWATAAAERNRPPRKPARGGRSG